MSNKVIKLEDIKKYGAQVVMIPFEELGEIKYKIVLLCNGQQTKMFETIKPLTAIQALNDFFIRYAAPTNAQHCIIEKFEEDILTAREQFEKFEEEVEKIKSMPETLDDLENKTLKELNKVAKDLGMIGYSAIKKEDLIPIIKDVKIKQIQGGDFENDARKYERERSKKRSDKNSGQTERSTTKKRSRKSS